MYVPKLDIPGRARYKTISGLAGSFYKAQKDVVLSGIDVNTLPYFAKGCLKRFFEVTDGEVRGALLEGDPWFFLGWRARIAQVDNAMVAAGAQVPARWALIGAQNMLLMMQLIANKRLVALGGVSIMVDEGNGEAPTPPGQIG